jgi:hypothetical protein
MIKRYDIRPRRRRASENGSTTLAPAPFADRAPGDRWRPVTTHVAGEGSGEGGS